MPHDPVRPEDPATCRETLAFFKSVILSGEPWTAHCQEAFDKSRNALNRLEAAQRPE